MDPLVYVVVTLLLAACALAGCYFPARHATRVDPAVVLRDVSSDGARPLPTGVSELDRVMGGGVVAGSVTLLFGPPGIGKSTLLFQVLAQGDIQYWAARFLGELERAPAPLNRLGQVPSARKR